MDKSKTEKSGIRPGVIVAVVAALGLLVAGRLILGGKKSNNETTPDSATTTEPSSTPQTAALAAAPPKPSIPAPHVPGTTPARNTQPVPASTAVAVDTGTPGATELMADWNVKLDDILGSNDEESKKADQLLAMWKNLPEDGQVETMQHISNLLPDEKFSALAQTFTNAATPEAVLDIIMTDALNRPNGLKLPVLLDVAKVPGHPKAEEARDILEVFVDADHGSDWAKWDKAVKDWLKENPDEPEK